MEISRKESVQNILTRRLNSQGVFPSLAEVVTRLSGEPMKIYWGIDPTGPSVHLGHTVPLLLLKELAQLGHRTVLVIGDATARIGDPTGKDSARKQLSGTEVAGNMKAYIEQVDLIFKAVPYEVQYNSQWLDAMNLAEVIKLASHVTVQQMIARDMFQERIKSERPIFLHEFLYPLMQGYDSVALQADGEIGGNDQVFNMLVGRDLVRAYLNKDKIVLGTRLLVDAASGKKMSKTEGGLVAINDSPQEIRRKILNDIDDKMIKTVFELCTEKDIAWIVDHTDEMAINPRHYKELLAEELVSMYQGGSRVDDLKQAEEISKGDRRTVLELLVGLNLANSNSSAKTLVEQGAVQLNGEVVKEWTAEIKNGDSLKVGKGKFYKIIK